MAEMYAGKTVLEGTADHRCLLDGDGVQPGRVRVFDRIGMFGTLTHHSPTLQVLLFGAALLLVQEAFSVCAARYTRRRSLVERIKAAD